jgi:dTDP-4-dehydrorhamnose 3,5-epimerase
MTRVIPTQLPEVLAIEPVRLRDARGFFIETWHQQRCCELGLPSVIMQDNLSWSHRHVLRGLHFQFPNSQAKLVQVLVGTVMDVAVDIRRGSPMFGRWATVELSAENQRQLYIPEGFAHGFCVVSDGALVAYKCFALYDPSCEQRIDWNDPALGIPWPTQTPILSSKDTNQPRLRDIQADRLPTYQSATTHGK